MEVYKREASEMKIVAWCQAVSGCLNNINHLFCVSLPFSSTEDYFSPLEGLVRPDITQDSLSSEASSVAAPGLVRSRARERRREGRSKTFDWAEFRPLAQALAQQRAQEAESLQTGRDELDCRRRREERRKMHECVSSSKHASAPYRGRTAEEGGGGIEQTDSVSPTSMDRQQRMEEVIEEHWRQVEKTPIREERRVPLPATEQSKETVELEQLLESYKQGVCLSSESLLVNLHGGAAAGVVAI